MTLKDLYKQTKNQQSGTYIGTVLVWLILWAFYIIIICSGWNFIANIFKLTPLTYFQTGVIMIWSYFVKGLYTNGNKKY